jgi:hypothetical protein
METQKSLNSQSDSEQKSFNVVGIPISNIKQYYRTVIIKTAWNWQKNRQEDQGVRILDPVIHPHIYSQLMFIKGAQNTQWRKYSPVQQMLLGKLDIQMWKTETRSLCLSPCTKINLKSKKNFLSRTQKSQHLRETMDKWVCIKLKCFCTAKETITRLKKQPK